MKKLLVLIFISVGVIVTGLAQIPTNGLVGYYPFSGNANDASGNGNNGVVNGATLTTDRFGNTNSAYAFNGTSSYIKVSNATNFDNSNFTYNYWVMGNTFALNGRAYNVLEVGSQGYNGGHYGLSLSVNNNYVNSTGWRVTSGNTDYSVVGFETGTLPNANTWYNVTVTRDNSMVRLYIGCQLVDSATNNGLLPYYNSPIDMFIGSRANLSLGQYFDGKIDDIRVYNRALSQSEIAGFCNEGICYQYVSVTDTLIINANIAGYDPIVYQNKIKVFPNPSSSQITIDYGSNYSTLAGYTVKINNSIGQTVYASVVTQQQVQINISTWTGNGIYFINLIDTQNNTIDVRKIVIQ